MAQQFDAKKLSTYEWGFIGASFLAIIFLFFHAYTVSVKGFAGASGSLSGWHFKGLWMPELLLFAAAGLVALRALKPEVLPALPVGTRLIVLAVAVFALLITLIRVFTYPKPPAFEGAGISAGAGFGSYLVLIAVLVATAFAALDFLKSGEKFPWQSGGAAGSPPVGGYSPPPPPPPPA